MKAAEAKVYRYEEMAKHLKKECPKAKEIIGCSHCERYSKKVFTDENDYYMHLTTDCTSKKLECSFCNLLMDPETYYKKGHTYKDCMHVLLMSKAGIADTNGIRKVDQGTQTEAR